MNTATRARELFDEGYCCTESVLAAFAEAAGLSPEHFLKIATGHCAGLAGTSGTCGALTGASMGLGFTFGRTDTDTPMGLCHANVNNLEKQFKSKFKSTNCTELLGVNLGTEEGMTLFKKRGLRNSRCRVFTEAAALMALDVIAAFGGGDAPGQP